MLEECVNNGGSCTSKAKEALKKIETSPKADWFEWWFGGRLDKKVFGTVLVGVLIASILSIIALISYSSYYSTGLSVSGGKGTDITGEVTGLTIVTAISAGILLLPSIRKLKVGEVELDAIPLDTAKGLELIPSKPEIPLISAAMALQDPSLESYRMPLQWLGLPLRQYLRPIMLPTKTRRSGN